MSEVNANIVIPWYRIYDYISDCTTSVMSRGSLEGSFESDRCHLVAKQLNCFKCNISLITVSITGSNRKIDAMKCCHP